MAQTAATALPSTVPPPSRAAMAALVGGLLAGAQDLLGASIVYKVPILKVMRTVASGLIGRDAAKNGGMTESMIGLGLHLGISVVAAGVYVAASRRWPILARLPAALLAGALFGAAMFVVMNGIVVPLSNAVPPHFNPIPASFDWAAKPAKALDFLSNVLFGVIIATVASLMLQRSRP